MSTLTRASALIAAAVYFLSSAHLAFADFRSSERWFNSLELTERYRLQSDLILLGLYGQFVDGQFGPGTHGALTSLQEQNGFAATGVLTENEMATLREAANQVRNELGIQAVRDDRGGAVLLLPRRFLSATTPLPDGTLYALNNNGVTLRTVRKFSSEAAFQALFAELSRSGAGRTIRYTSFGPDRFIVSRQEYGRYFYAMHYRTDEGSIGFEVSWLKEYQREGVLITAFSASHFLPLAYSEQLETDTALGPYEPSWSSATSDLVRVLPGRMVERIGSFVVFADSETVIALDGEITESSALEFVRTLKSRPNARLLVLNSVGGLVDEALLIAHEIHERGISTIIPEGYECYSACAFMFFAGRERSAVGKLGVHQVWNEANDLISGQAKLSDVLEALSQFGVSQSVISTMLRTPPDEIHIFSHAEIDMEKVEAGDPHRYLPLGEQPALRENTVVPADVTPTDSRSKKIENFGMTKW